MSDPAAPPPTEAPAEPAAADPTPAETAPAEPAKAADAPTKKPKAEMAINVSLSQSKPHDKNSADLSNKILGKYSDSVKAAEAKRKSNFQPLFEGEGGIEEPDQREVVMALKQDLHIQHQSQDGWDGLLENEMFQKRMQFLRDRAKTGQFIEQYGEEGYYQGDFLYGMRHGQGKHFFRSQVYEGEWKWDMRHGEGTLKEPDGSVCKGEWKEGRQHGFGIIKAPDDTVVYEGEFKDGKRHGLGRQLFDNGDRHDGGWCEGRLHDRGVYYFKEGHKFYGMWNKGVYDGVGVFHYADGSISRRVYHNGVLQSVQDFESSTQRFGKALTREGMQKHTSAKDFPKDHEIFCLHKY
eukprot:gnl/MRDRNA2_/MRDRNA2_91383_c0_seq1.p1 gnl/MRDRNA2_/MRDRNA2_91383_c0~~gnl/MRDRNA2_/MRDRNA2_91383_c0_seq1.p1  ORF type:complete len:350 (+),score=88.61 gnl/MRDRNA2_/MRDRNA2_91383_c0_seq1:84-1133(+)